jgi:DNA repair photolyase
LKWKKTTVIRADQKRVPARAPIIISASRATDIPAFYTDWLIHRLEAGYAVWVNPFNKRQPFYVSFEAARLFVFWTKNPRPLMPRLDEFEKRDINYYFQFTLNDYESEQLEPRLPPLQERIRTFRELSDKIGRHRVIWRFDPLIVTPGLSVEHLLEKIASIGSRLMHKTDKLVVSFVDVTAYQKVQNSLIRELDLFDRSSVFSAEPSESQIRQIARGLEQLKTRWYRQGWDITVATCGESMDLKTDYGIVKNKCIDDDLIRRVFSHDQTLMRFVDYGETDPDTARQLEMFATPGKVDLKDKGQRKACRCISSKDIGMYDTCPHFCVYCYANTSRHSVNRQFARHSKYGERLIDSPDSSHP